ncbi:sensor histidine kinase [Bombilactobacillus bombi]|uniref:histidine kinase n=1 Tax=Bombilactobacillus bombi TaxID=1303590 RepID=A0A417Z871_9LACO|nr:histidine kinase [Bombilactobacillus bombi]RHW46832.1 sensor histidine kinase [Bombilactobacillus bombi]
MKLAHNIIGELIFFLILGVALLIHQQFQPYMIIYLLLSIVSLNLQILLPHPWGDYFLICILGIFACWYPRLSYFFPMISRWVLLSASPNKLIFLMIPLIWQHNWTSLLISGAVILVIYFDFQNHRWQQLNQSRLQLLDDSFEKQAQLQAQNLALKANEQTKIQLQLAQERNHIARDIHDNVGHLLSSSIIQLGAIQTINQDQQLKPVLTQLNLTLNQAMTSIRVSVHDIQQHALTLSQALKPIIADFSFCPLQIQGSIFKDLSNTFNNVIIMTIKEALTNIMKHSQAHQVLLKFQILPAFYQVQILNDGPQNTEFNRGMGLISMQQRAEEIGGQLHIYQGKNKFLITLILPKKDFKYA